MIISGSFGQQIVPRVHDMSQVDSIFIFCGNKKRHEQWAKEWPKIKGVFTEIAPICEALKQAAQQSEQNTVSISFMAANTSASKKNLDQLDSSFMYTNILKEILLSIEFQEKHFKEFIDYCREQFYENDQELNNIKKFEREYRTKTPIWWYTFECFLYPMVNRALRLMDVDTIIKMGFFLCDLHHQIEQLHSEKFNGHQSAKIFMVYRGQGMSKADFEQMQKTKGGLMSFNNFLTTSKNRQISLEFARHGLTNPDIIEVLFVMKIDPSVSTTPFASITDVTYFHGEEDEVLFSMHTVFRICDIKPMGENSCLFQVDLVLTSDNDIQLRTLTDRFREEIHQHSDGWYQLGSLLLKMGQFDKAQQLYEILLEQTTNEHEKGDIYHQIGSTKAAQGEYSKALSFYEKALEIRQKTLPPNHPDLASSYNNIGLVYASMDEYSKALSYHEKALEIRQKSLPSNHPDFASSYNNIGLVYASMDEYSKALSFHERAVNIGQSSLPPNHPDLQMYEKNLDILKKKL
jgi:tetratricopeptide (TPR) repeat protein